MVKSRFIASANNFNLLIHFDPSKLYRWNRIGRELFCFLFLSSWVNQLVFFWHEFDFMSFTFSLYTAVIDFYICSKMNFPIFLSHFICINSRPNLWPLSTESTPVSIRWTCLFGRCFIYFLLFLSYKNDSLVSSLHQINLVFFYNNATGISAITGLIIGTFGLIKAVFGMSAGAGVHSVTIAGLAQLKIRIFARSVRSDLFIIQAHVMSSYANSCWLL